MTRTKEKTFVCSSPVRLPPPKVFVFGPDRKIWELDKGSATAGDVLGRSYMQRFYEGAVLHDRRRKGLGAEGRDSNRRTETAWVNGREVRTVGLHEHYGYCWEFFHLIYPM